MNFSGHYHRRRGMGGEVGVIDDDRSVEAQIAECCQAIYWATDADVALNNWSRLRKLIAERSDAQTQQFLRERMNNEVRQPHA